MRRVSYGLAGAAALAATFGPAELVAQSIADTCSGYLSAGIAAGNDANLAGAEGFYLLGIEAGLDAGDGAGDDCLVKVYGKLMAVYAFQRRLDDEARILERRLRNRLV